MIERLKPYPAYKDSGVEWLGQVPEHWEVLSGHECFVERKQPNIDLVETTVLSLSYGRIVVKPEGKLRGLLPASFETYQIVDPGNIVCRPTDLQNDQNSLRFGLVRNRGIITSAYMSFRTTERLDSNFGYLLLHAYDVRKIFYGLGSGLRQNLDWEDFKRLPCLAPPLPEQAAIARFLDYMERRIRWMIRARQRRIKLLEEYKQAIIHQAVTGQIDVRTGKPYLAYKESGVEWLGQVPAHWEVRRLKRIARLNPSKSEVPLALRDDRAVFLPMERVGSDGRFDASEVRPISDLWNGFTYFRQGDVIVAKITPCFENDKGACLENLPTALGFGSTEFHVIRPSKAVISAYLYRVTTLSEFRRLGADEMTGAAGQQRVPIEFIANFLIPIPPLPEQTAIVEYLDDQTAKINAAIEASRREIDFLHEYHTRLISDVVTGKVDVREVAAQLPEEPAEEEEPLGTEDAEATADEETDNNEETADAEEVR